MPEKISRDIKTWEVVKLLAEKYNEPDHYACATEVANSSGVHARRWLDFVAVDCWPSSGVKIMAFEVKISKSDFRRELTDPSKHNIFFDEVDNYSIVAPDYVLDDMSIIPPKWGVYHVVRNSEGKLELKTVRKPLALHDEQQRDRKIGRGFMASLVRAINKQGATRARLYEERQDIESRIRAEIENKLTHGRVITDYEYEEMQRLGKTCRRLGISGYCGISDWEVKQFKEAQRVASNVGRVERQLRALSSDIRSAHKSVKDLLEGIEENGGDPGSVLKAEAEDLMPDDACVAPETVCTLIQEEK